MALTKCKECGQTVSAEACACPHCGSPQRAAPPAIPTVIVQQAQEKKKGSGIFSGCLVVFLIIFIVGILGGIVSQTGKKGGSDPKEIAHRQIGIAEWTWREAGFDSAIEASFTITNNSAYDIKNITIKFTHFTKSGTQIDSNTRTIYEIIKAGESKAFKDFNMGFIHSQPELSAASIKDFVIVR